MLNNNMADEGNSYKKIDITLPMREETKKYYGTSFLILLLCNFIYLIPHFEHYDMGGMQGSILLFAILIILLVIDIIGMFILAAILRKVMIKRWSKVFVVISAGAIVVFFIINVYRATLPLPYLRLMIDKIPDAVSYFEKNETELYEKAANGEVCMYRDADLQVGPMINMLYIYVENPADYPVQTGQIRRFEYIHPIDEHWYLWLYQGPAG